MKRRILIVEDHQPTAVFVKATLEYQGYEAQHVGNGLVALSQIAADPPDLVLLDVGLPGMDGMEVCRHVRQQERYVPIIMLTGQSNEKDKVTGLDLGADDYITKPFGARELLARVRAVLRLASQDVPKLEQPFIKIDELIIDREQHIVLSGDQPIDLTPKEFDLLAKLVWERGKAFSRQELLKEIWGYEFVGKTRTLDVHIQQLRSKIEPDPSNPRYLLTVRGVGYKFAAAEKTETDPDRAD
ncbi:MAG: response regulator transcription factor [Anaerolineae bacterium]|nr:response regulator transcription factor [Anaerolineae bacterium]